MSNINIQENIILAPYTSFKIGGPARFFCEVKNIDELEEAVEYARENNLAAFVMGGGSNILVSDEGFGGLVIKISSQSNGNIPPLKMRMENSNYFLECWAGESLASLVKLTADSSLSGLEWAAGIPGSVGGAVRGNAGAFGGTMADIIESVKALEIPDIHYQISNKLQVANYKKEKCNFGYRDSVFKQNENLVVVSVVLKLVKGDKKEIESKIKDTIAKRANRYPNFPSAGSFFQNPVVKDAELIAKFEKDRHEKCRNNKIPAGWLITECDLKGKKVGDVQVSDEHGNFIINLGNGKASDVIMLASIIKQKIRTELNVQLVEEIKYVGF